MNTSRIDFAPSSLRAAVHRIHPAIWAIGTIGVVLCVSAAIVGYDLQRQRYERKQEIDQIRLKYQVRKPSTSTSLGTPVPDTQVDAVNGIIDRLNIPWGHVFKAIESATPPNIALLELVPDVKRNAVRGTAEAKTTQELLDYIALLGAQSFFENVVLLHHEINEQDMNKPVRFQFVAAWEANGK